MEKYSKPIPGYKVLHEKNKGINRCMIMLYTMYKQVIVVRRDLRLGKGKLAAQVAHASCEAVFSILERGSAVWREWLDSWKRSGQEKVVLRVDTLNELLELYNKAKAAGLPISLVRDAGHTQVPPGTITAIAIGPAPEHEIDKITGHLKLL